MWKAVGKSVIGTSHLRGQLPCQDFSDYFRCQIGGESTLVAAISDGAGSAAFSHLGSEETVSVLLRQLASYDRAIADISREDVQSWFARVLKHLRQIAEREKIEIGDLACTVLVAALGERHAVFAQIGDGAWISEMNGVLGAVTWPDNGEFANETKFITSPDALHTMQFQKYCEPLTAVAGFSDGIQSLALTYATKNVHAPFFEPMFAALKTCEDETSLLSPLLSFLSSEQVNERTDDDKTLVLLARVMSQKSENELG